MRLSRIRLRNRSVELHTYDKDWVGYVFRFKRVKPVPRRGRMKGRSVTRRKQVQEIVLGLTREALLAVVAMGMRELGIKNDCDLWTQVGLQEQRFDLYRTKEAKDESGE